MTLGITQQGRACKRCIAKGDFCYQHLHQRPHAHERMHTRFQWLETINQQAVRLGHCEEAIKKKDGQISMLESTLANRNRQAAANQAMVVAQYEEKSKQDKNRIAVLESMLHDRTHQLQEHKLQMEGHCKEAIKKKDEVLQAMNQVSQERLETIHQQAVCLGHCKEAIKKKDGQISMLESTLANRNRQAATNQAMVVAQYEEKSKKDKNRIAVLESMLQDRTHQLQEHKLQMEGHCKEAIKKKDEVLQATNQVSQERLETIHQQAVRLGHCKEAIKKKDGQISMLESTLANRNRQASSNEAMIMAQYEEKSKKDKDHIAVLESKLQDSTQTNKAGDSVPVKGSSNENSPQELTINQENQGEIPVPPPLISDVAQKEGVEATEVDEAVVNQNIKETNEGEEANAVEERNKEEEKEVKEEHNKKEDNKPRPSLWKLAGRSIRKTTVGKTILNGIRDTFDGTKKTLGIGVGRIVICVAETRVYRAEEIVRGVVEMDLTEPIQANGLTVRLEGVQESMVLTTSTVTNNSTTSSRGGGHHSTTTTMPSTSKEKKVVYTFNYDIGGTQEYDCRASFPFEVVIPRLQRRMSQETQQSLMGSLIKSVQTVGAAMQSPAEWTLIATLYIPGRLPMSTSARIHVADEVY